MTARHPSIHPSVRPNLGQPHAARLLIGCLGLARSPARLGLNPMREPAECLEDENGMCGAVRWRYAAVRPVGPPPPGVARSHVAGRRAAPPIALAGNVPGHAEGHAGVRGAPFSLLRASRKPQASLLLEYVGKGRKLEAPRR